MKAQSDGDDLNPPRTDQSCECGNHIEISLKEWWWGGKEKILPIPLRLLRPAGQREKTKRLDFPLQTVPRVCDDGDVKKDPLHHRLAS